MRDKLLKLATATGLVGALACAGWWASRSAEPHEPASKSPMAAPTAPSLPARPPPSAAPGSAPPARGADHASADAAVPDRLDAAQLTERAKARLALDPASALHDIEQADALAGPENETRRALEIHALVRLGQVGLARTLTDRFYRSFPDSERAAELERLTGYHPRPRGP